MLVSVNLNDQEEAIINNFAKSNNLTISEVVRQAIFNQIEYFNDLKREEKLDEADLEAKKTDKRFTSEEVFSPLRKSLNV